MSADLQYMLAPDVSIRQLAGGLHALATGMDTLTRKDNCTRMRDA